MPNEVGSPLEDTYQQLPWIQAGGGQVIKDRCLVSTVGPWSPPLFLFSFLCLFVFYLATAVVSFEINLHSCFALFITWSVAVTQAHSYGISMSLKLEHYTNFCLSPALPPNCSSKDLPFLKAHLFSFLGSHKEHP